MNLLNELYWLIPNWGMLGMSLAWVAAAFLASTFMNHQTAENKKLNALKTLGLVALLVSWTYAASYYAGSPITIRAALLGFSGWLLFEIGDLLAFLVFILKLSPGGPAGWFWRKVAWTLTHMQAFAARKAEQALRTTERALIDRHIDEKNGESEVTPPKSEPLERPAGNGDSLLSTALPIPTSRTTEAS